MMFFLKKLIGGLLMPLPLGFIILSVAMVCWWRGRRKLSGVLGVAVLTSWFLLSLTPVANAILAPLEFTYERFSGQPVDTVVVLGGGHSSDDRTPLSSLLTPTSLNRLTEGVLILRAQPSAKLALSGYGGNDPLTNAEAMARVAIALGVDGRKIILARGPQDTSGEAVHWAKNLRGQQVALVTSATHMRRAVYLFEQQGLPVIPAPTRFLSAGSGHYDWRDWLPDAYNIEKVELAWHEYLGLWWAQLRS